MTHVLLTGASGTIGSALVPRLLAEPAQQVTLLLRAGHQGDLPDRLSSLRAAWALADGDPRLQRLHAVQGDIAQPQLGLSEAQQAELAQRCTHIIHCAASVKLNMALDEAQATAVTPTRSILALARRCAAHGQLQKIDLVSTVGVWGRTPGAMPERRLPEVTEFHNTYEAAKAEAERVVWAEGDGLPITVHRPSMVVGDSRDGRVIHFQVFYHLCEFLSGSRTFGIMPTLGHTRLDTVPVDWVADAIAWASAHPQTAGQIFHLCSGPDRAIPITTLQQVVRDTWQRHGRQLPTLRTLDRRWLERLVPVIGALAGARTRRALRGLPPVLAYLAEDQGFSNTDSLRRLQAAGLPLPDVHQYLGPVLQHYLAQQSARAAAKR
jgi:thioester reductase-like protein